MEESEFGTETVTLAPGDVLLLYTDGVTEAINPQEEEFGQERLAEMARRGSHCWSAQELVREVRRDLQEFTHGQPLADDATIVACKTTVQ